MQHATDVDEYISNAPKDVQGKLKEMRAAIKECAPKAMEKISYGMPYFGYKGRLIYFAYFKNHIGFYIMPPMVEMYKKDLKEYETSTGTVRFPFDKKLPISLIRKLVKARVKHNEEVSQ